MQIIRTFSLGAFLAGLMVSALPAQHGLVPRSPSTVEESPREGSDVPEDLETIVPRSADAEVTSNLPVTFADTMTRFAASPYLALASLSTSPGVVTSSGTIPLADDSLLAFSLMSPDVFVGFQGVSNVAAQGFGVIHVPPFSWLSGTHFYVGFVTLSAGGTYGISDAKLLSIL